VEAHHPPVESLVRARMELADVRTESSAKGVRIAELQRAFTAIERPPERSDSLCWWDVVTGDPQTVAAGFAIESSSGLKLHRKVR